MKSAWIAAVAPVVDGAPDLRLIWTDVWMWRDGKWQIVASQDSEVPEKK